MKVTLTEALCAEGMEMLSGCETFVAHDAHPHNYFDQLKDTDAFIVRVADKGAIDAQTMDASPALKVIGRTGIGYDSVDVDAATARGIPVVITPGANNRGAGRALPGGCGDRLAAGGADHAALRRHDPAVVSAAAESLRILNMTTPPALHPAASSFPT